MQIIHRLTVVSNPTRVFEVGTEIEGREVIEIKQVGEELPQHIHSEFYVLDENGHLITSVENAPVIVDYRQIAVHDAEDVTELKAAAGTTAWINQEIKLLELRKYRAEKLITDPQLRQQLLTAVEAQRCSLQSSLQRL
ncbi:hypothetical protein [Paenibacillus amylolyticus]|uniref:hypothetical protein n=1 Tax=Paenibacillus amylolyticus TaxID=1451 RepID=UPI00201DF2D8|nr:hypothetical protein [Paenibacillus amylolyticus]MCL6661743.1 hypothetical protein [Paenibacillus amylolyticus]